MKEVYERLRNLARNGNNDAAELALQIEGLNDNEFALWLVENDRQVRNLLGFDYDIKRNKEEDRAFLKGYSDVLVKGKKIFNGKDRYDVSGNKINTLDHYMEAFGIADINDDKRSAFSNPNNENYWAKKSEQDKALAAINLGYKNAAEMESDIKRAGDDYQRRNQIEGYDADNNINVIDWSISALKGFATPRIKEAQLAGKDVSWQDVVGDLAELGISFVPGVGLVSKSGKVISKLPVAKTISKTNIGDKALSAVTMTGDQFAMPFISQAIDAGLLYRNDPNNYRSELDFSRAAAQGLAGAMAKGAFVSLGTSGGAKDLVETRMGNEAGGASYSKLQKDFESIGENTEDLIAARQKALERRAERANKRSNVTLQNDADFAVGGASFDDLLNAENYRILNNETNRLANSNKARQAYRQEKYDGTKSKKKYNYPQVNEQGAEEIILLPDGRLISASLVVDGKIKFPNANYDVPLPEGSKKLEFVYDGAENSRNRILEEKIKQDDLLSRKLYAPSVKAFKAKEIAKNTIGAFGLNAAAREGVESQMYEDLKQSRETAIWNRNVKKLRPLVANPKLSPDERKRNAAAVMDVMTYGTNPRRIPNYKQNKALYDTIIKTLESN